MPPKFLGERPSLRRIPSRSSKYAHVGPKVDSRLPSEFMPSESQFQLSKHKRSELHIGEEGPIQEETENLDGDENDYQFSETDGFPLPNRAIDSQHSSTSRYASPAASSTYSAEIYAQFGGEAISSPTYHSDTDAEPGQNSRASSRRHSLVLAQPTSNRAQYARNTDSYRVKMREGVERQPLSSELFTQPRVTTPEWERKVRFDEPVKPPSRPRPRGGYDRVRSHSMFTTPSMGDGIARSFQDALDRTCQDLLSLRDELYNQRRTLDVHSVLGKRGNMPVGVNGVREKIVQVVERYETETNQHRELIMKNEKRIDEKERRIRQLEEALKGKSEELKMSQRDGKSREEKQEARIKELEDALHRSVEKTERQRTSHVHGHEAQRKLEETASWAADLQSSLTQKTKEFEEVVKSHALEVERLQKELQDRPKHAVSISDMQTAFLAHQEQEQKIRELEEALQKKTINDALEAGTDTPEWHSLFKRERKVKAAQDTEITHLKASITNLNTYHIELESERNELREYVAAHRDTVQTLQEQLATSTREAEQWHEEYNQQKEMLDGRAFAEQTELEALRQEMQHTISTYHSLLPSPSHPDALQITGLLRTLAATEKTLEETTSRLNVLKEEQLALEKGIEKVMDEKNEVLAENDRLLNGPPPLTRIVYDSDTGQQVRLPPWHTADRLFARQAARSLFLTSQTAARRKIQLSEQIVEKARAWKMGKHYPPSRLQETYKQAVKKSEWERWEVQRWVQEHGSDGEYSEALELGLLGSQKARGRGTNEWRGRRLESMGLRSWDP
ncbi:hypothetical protein DPSP01_010952 [Paraphaeosphaeria sporulosa]|uniref:Uncharacterized protein n=1 Tax=Paraphaeosphaeria sporulosa TaxID=1460663 RepID=A0A177D0W9_9PLEO|nr:uncharacterized protein CC84DRAFT_1255244 [Paraphaeosphaeria sporulosa]OAG13136.1 hypothetical protein CC84DRAFT_1255244 [Paraphaeosphaeria sporulosa]